MIKQQLSSGMTRMCRPDRKTGTGQTRRKFLQISAEDCIADATKNNEFLKRHLQP